MIQMPCAIKAPLLGMVPVHRARRHVNDQWQDAARHAPSAGAVRRLFVDVSVISRSDARTGIQRVVRTVLGHLLDHPPAGHEVVPVAATRQTGYRRADLSALFPERRSPRPGDDDRVTPACGDTFFALDLAARVLPCHWNQLQQWKRAGVSIQAVVYDLLPVLHPDWFTPRAVSHFKRWLKTLAIFADRLHCISQVVHSDVQAWFAQQYGVSLAPQVLQTFPLGSDIESGPATGVDEQGEAALAFAARRPTALMVGTIEPRKGHAEVLRAFEELWREGGQQQLLVVGAPGWQTEALQHRLREHPRAGGHVLWVSNAGDALLVRLYQAAGGVIVASAGEGLGLPVLEATHFGRPLLVRDLPVFREVAGGNATYFPNLAAGLSADVLRDWFNRSVRDAGHGPTVACATWAESVAVLLHNMGLPGASPATN